MTANSAIQVIVYLLVLLLLAKPLGGYMARVYAGSRTRLDPIMGPIERWIYRLMGNLRRKLEPDPARPHYVLTEPGVGYRLASSA